MPPEAQPDTDSRRVSRLVAGRVDPLAVLTAEIGPAFAEYRRRWEAARAFQEQPAFPLHLDFEMKFQCNLRCPMCLMSLPPDKRRLYGRQDESLHPDTVLEIVAEGVARGQRALGFGGLWEPLLAPELPEIVAASRAMGLVDVMFNTNGLLLTAKTGRALIKAGLTRLMISLDAATAATYNQMRPGSDFETVTANIENFLALRQRLGRGLPLVRLSFCRTALNEDELEPFLERWQGRVDFFSIQAYGRYPVATPPGFARGGPPPPLPGRCAQPHKRLLIRHQGQVLPCCDVSGLPLSLGSIYEDSLADIWRGAKLVALRQALAEGGFQDPAGPCRACQQKFQSQGQWGMRHE
ncbi:MAG: radical SAM protein [Candidatus Adiutrix sp.]|jgi:radical SAM protein with 4Fe4S-binding SPASM domain|nr:radical SAM protein [Candidatus Adiutrix sp.]